jgi:hypothetical protein
MANGVINISGFARMNASKPEVQKIIGEFGDPTAGPRAADFELLFIVSCKYTLRFLAVTNIYRMVVSPVPRTKASLVCLWV